MMEFSKTGWSNYVWMRGIFPTICIIYPDSDETVNGIEFRLHDQRHLHGIYPYPYINVYRLRIDTDRTWLRRCVLY